tara:strand:- start:11730 stop:12014 length:285 start_codon:yes stop_codon:yes gene_type:complete
MSTYAIIPQEQWVEELSDRFPHAPIIKNYRALVFADAETEQLKVDYAERGIVELTSLSEIIEHMQSDLKPWVILQVEPLREVMQHFNPPSDEVI